MPEGAQNFLCFVGGWGRLGSTEALSLKPSQTRVELHLGVGGAVVVERTWEGNNRSQSLRPQGSKETGEVGAGVWPEGLHYGNTDPGQHCRSREP